MEDDCDYADGEMTMQMVTMMMLKVGKLASAGFNCCNDDDGHAADYVNDNDAD